MERQGQVFVGIDVAKKRNAFAVAEDGREGQIRYLGEIDSTPEATVKLIRKLEDRYETIHFCYEAGPTGYGLYRQVRSLGHDCMVVAPSLIPRRASDRVKTNRRDAEGLARLLRSGELTSVWVPDETHESIRDLVRTKGIASEDYRRKRQHVSSFLLRHGRSYPGTATWGGRHLRWLDGQSFAHPAQRLAFQELLGAVRAAAERIGRIEAALVEFVPQWTMAPVVAALQSLRGIAFATATTLVAEAGDLRRFDHPRHLMAFLGLVPSERSTGEARRQGGITKTGNVRARTALVEAAWTYRHSADLGAAHQRRQLAVPEAIRGIAWKAQARLCARYRRLIAKGKRATVVTTAIARELVGFLWDIARHVDPMPTPGAVN
ncbi:IS110 family transposase [Acetobacter sacchari]|uniref:IS110 family transposase n=1 Tax=Acetobacter sacchari TaxID=2661687 RepID=A0ABS3LWM6_9PROT|nr:IS110 family transposase [Acetobacter sacchari]MBO1360309.1 IS110 family transposase [Acetobacter sacchari]